MSSPEFSSVDTIPELVTAVMKRLQFIITMISDPKDHPMDEIARKQHQLENALLEEQAAIASVFNICIVALGTQFSSGDGNWRPLIL